MVTTQAYPVYNMQQPSAAYYNPQQQPAYNPQPPPVYNPQQPPAYNPQQPPYTGQQVALDTKA